MLNWRKLFLFLFERKNVLLKFDACQLRRPSKRLTRGVWQKKTRAYVAERNSTLFHYFSICSSHTLGKEMEEKDEKKKHQKRSTREKKYN